MVDSKFTTRTPQGHETDRLTHQINMLILPNILNSLKHVARYVAKT